MTLREQLHIAKESLPLSRAFVVHIPNSFAVPIALQDPYINIIFDCDTHEYHIVEGQVMCKADHITTHGVLYKNNLTLSLAYYIQNSKPFKIEVPSFITRYYNSEFSHIEDINTKISLVKWIEYAEQLYAIYNELDWQIIDACETSLYSNFIFNLQSIEKNGLKVDRSLFEHFFEKSPHPNDYAYSRYNPYTATGRPSNAYNNTNFAALPKENLSRSAFISRFNQGRLIELDFKSYHVHLVANLIGYKFDCDDIHTYFGKFYFKTGTLTPAQYEESKTRTFKSLYSSDRPDHPFFNEIRALTQLLFEEYKTTGYLTTPIFHRRISSISEPNINKVFNYFIQSYETERNASVIQAVLDILEGFDSKVVLYTYDSILIDFNLLDGRLLLDKILSILTSDKYPFSLKQGEDYAHMNPMKKQL